MKRFLVFQILILSIIISTTTLLIGCLSLDTHSNNSQMSNNKADKSTKDDFKLTMIEDPFDKKSRKNKEDKVINHKNTKSLRPRISS